MRMRLYMPVLMCWWPEILFLNLLIQRLLFQNLNIQSERMAKDLFSKQASFYAKYRPGYPPELFEYILSFVKQKDTVWDCATGNGQAATELAKYFKTVHATDISEKQLQQAMESDRIIYAMASAES